MPSASSALSNETSVVARQTTTIITAAPRQKACPCGHVGPCHKSALRTFVHAFGLSYGLRSVLSLLARAFSLARTDPRRLRSLYHLVSEQHLVARESAVRLGLFTGIFAGGFQAVRCALHHLRVARAGNGAAVAAAAAGGAGGGKHAAAAAAAAAEVKARQNARDVLIAGFVAGLLTSPLYTGETKRTLALYLFARFLQCIYNVYVWLRLCLLAC
jgi:hypothetical protein